MASLQKEVLIQVAGTVIGGLVLAGLTGKGAASKFFRFVILAGVLAVIVLIVAHRR